MKSVVMLSRPHVKNKMLSNIVCVPTKSEVMAFGTSRFPFRGCIDVSDINIVHLSALIVVELVWNCVLLRKIERKCMNCKCHQLVVFLLKITAHLCTLLIRFIAIIEYIPKQNEIHPKLFRDEKENRCVIGSHKTLLSKT